MNRKNTFFPLLFLLIPIIFSPIIYVISSSSCPLDGNCLICIWNDIPLWAKFLILIALVGTALLGGWYAGIIAAGYWGLGTVGALLAGSAAAAFTGYETMGKFFDFDNAVWNTEYGDPLDAVEETINLVSPVPNIVGDATGLKMPGSQSAYGLVDQAVEESGHRYSRIEEAWRVAAEDK